MSETKPIQSLLRGIEILQLLTEAPHGLRLNELADAMGLKTPTVHNMVKTLSSRGFVEKLSTNRYAAGPAIIEMADRLHTNHQHMHAEEAVRSLAAALPLSTVNYTVPTGNRLVVRLRMSPDRPNVLQRPVGQTNNLYGSATGLAFLAFAPADQVSAMRQEQPFHEVGIRLWSSSDDLDAHTGECRDIGYAYTPYEGQELFRVSAPVLDTNGVAVAYLGLAMPSNKVADRKEEKAIGDIVLRTTNGLTERIRRELS